MFRIYRKSHSSCLGREMEMLIFGHAGAPVLVFPTTGGRFYEFEDRGMVAALADRIEEGRLRLYCVDSVDSESWYNRNAAPKDRIRRHMQFEEYILGEAVPQMQQSCGQEGIATLGCSLGGFHALNFALRHPDLFTSAFSFSGAFDLAGFLEGYSDRDTYLQLPFWYLPNLADPWFLERYRRNRLLLASGWDDQCLSQNQQMDQLLNEKEIPHEFSIWDSPNAHDWPTWRQMAREYL
jgi:esterase/lipase superfamily enzyme